MRGPKRAWPKRIIEVAAPRPDLRAADPQATVKISREELDAVLQRTKSGTRAAHRYEPAQNESFAGPRDDGPEVTIVRIGSMEFEDFDPASLPAPPSAAPPSATRRLRVTPQLVLLVGLALFAFVTLAGIIGFFAGRVTLR